MPASPPFLTPACIVKLFIDLLSTIPGARDLQISLCRDCIEWSKAEKRIFLRQSLETRLAALYLQNRQYHDAVALTSALLHELKKLDDKMLLVEVQLLESRVFLELKNYSKSRVRKLYILLMFCVTFMPYFALF